MVREEQLHSQFCGRLLVSESVCPAYVRLNARASNPAGKQRCMHAPAADNAKSENRAGGREEQGCAGAMAAEMAARAVHVALMRVAFAISSAGGFCRRREDASRRKCSRGPSFQLPL